MTVNQKKKRKKRTLKACTNACTEKHSIGGDISIGGMQFLCKHFENSEGVRWIPLAEEGWTFQTILKHIGGVHQGGEKAKKKKSARKEAGQWSHFVTWKVLFAKQKTSGTGAGWPGGSGQWNRPDSSWNVGHNRKRIHEIDTPRFSRTCNKQKCDLMM